MVPMLFLVSLSEMGLARFCFREPGKPRSIWVTGRKTFSRKVLPNPQVEVVGSGECSRSVAVVPRFPSIRKEAGEPKNRKISIFRTKEDCLELEKPHMGDPKATHVTAANAIRKKKL